LVDVIERYCLTIYNLAAQLRADLLKPASADREVTG
jgi:hypothetical protein